MYCYAYLIRRLQTVYRMHQRGSYSSSVVPTTSLTKRLWWVIDARGGLQFLPPLKVRCLILPLSSPFLPLSSSFCRPFWLPPGWSLSLRHCHWYVCQSSLVTSAGRHRFQGCCADLSGWLCVLEMNRPTAPTVESLTASTNGLSVAEDLLYQNRNGTLAVRVNCLGASALPLTRHCDNRNMTNTALLSSVHLLIAETCWRGRGLFTGTVGVRRTPLSLSTVGDPVYPVASALTWNSLPQQVTSAPLCLFSEVASRLSSSGVPSHYFYRNFCSACAVTVQLSFLDA